MKICFLDVDGVLNYSQLFLDGRFGPLPLDHLCIQRLHRVVRETHCRIVLSSSWRGMDWNERKLAADFVFECYFGDRIHNNPLIIRHQDGSTVRLSGPYYNGRGSEIAEWLSRHPEVSRYAIVDDDSDMLPEQMPFFVQTSFQTGLQDEHADRLIGILNG